MACKKTQQCPACNNFITLNNYRKHIDSCTGHISAKIGHRGGWNKGLTKEMDERIKIYSESSSKTLIGRKGRPHTEESKANLSKIAKANGLGGHTSKRKLYFKKNDGTEVYLQSSYEIKFAEILEELNIIWERPAPLIWIDDEGKDHRYYPDFKIGEKYFDTKNDYLAKIDARKIELVSQQNDVDLTIVTLRQITKEFIAAIV